MIKCEPGHYCPASTTHTRQYPCVGGKYNPNRQSTSDAACLACSAGFYCPEGAYRMFNCPSGYFCGPNTENYLLTPCLAGTYRILQGGTVSGDCLACPAGMYCEPGSAYPIPCPKGTYRDTTGAKAATVSTVTTNAAETCLPCTGGNKCPFVGMTAVIACEPGYYSPAGSQTCFQCQLGNRCDTSGQVSLTAYESTPSISFNNYFV